VLDGGLIEPFQDLADCRPPPGLAPPGQQRERDDECHLLVPAGPVDGKPVPAPRHASCSDDPAVAFQRPAQRDSEPDLYLLVLATWQQQVDVSAVCALPWMRDRQVHDVEVCGAPYVHRRHDTSRRARLHAGLSDLASFERVCGTSSPLADSGFWQQRTAAPGSSAAVTPAVRAGR
jgi:hypothetical protein